MTQLDDLQNTFNIEMPRRSPTLTNAIVAYDADPNLGGAPAILQVAPLSTWFYEETAARWWRKKDSSFTGWVDQTGGAAPGGTDTQIQFNNAGSFGGIPGFTWNSPNLDIDGTLNFRPQGSGSDSTAIGRGASVTGSFAIGIGLFPVAPGPSDLFIGDTAQFNGTPGLGLNIGIGSDVDITDTASFNVNQNLVIGSLAKATDTQFGFAIGPSSQVGLIGTLIFQPMALGPSARSEARRATAIGPVARVGIGHDHSMALGAFSLTDRAQQFKIGDTGAQALDIFSQGYFALAEIAGPSGAEAGYGRFFVKTDTLPYFMDSTGAETAILGAPTLHASQHENGGADEISVASLSGLLADDQTAGGLRTATTIVSISAATAPTTGQILKATSGTTAIWQDDTGVTAHALAGADHTASTLATLNSKVSDATLVDTNDARFSDARTPLAHAASHAGAGGDAITSLGALTMTGLLTLSGAPTNDAHAATKLYVDNAIAGLDWQNSIIDKDLLTPPVSPTTGDRYIVAGAGGTALLAWATHEEKIAEWNGTSWDFTVPNLGFAVLAEDENTQYTYNGAHPAGTWVLFSTSIGSHALGGSQHTADTLANLNLLVSDATLVDTGDARFSDARTPLAHLLGGAEHTADTLANLNLKVSDATLVDTGDARFSDDRDPNIHGLGDITRHSAATLAQLNALVSDATLVDTGDARFSDDRTASGLRSATTIVGVSAATAPTLGQVLTATSGTAATWQTPSSGNVTKVGTPVDNQIGVWTGDGTLEGHVDLIWDGTNLGIGTATPDLAGFSRTLNVTGTIDAGIILDGNLRYSIGSLSTNLFRIFDMTAGVNRITVQSNGNVSFGAGSAGNEDFFWDDVNDRLTITSANANGITSIKDTALASGVSATAALLHRTSVNMTGELGPELRFQIEDDTSGVLNIAGVSAIRDGADNSGALRWTTWDGGVATEKMRLTSVGRLGLGVTPLSHFHIEDDVNGNVQKHIRNLSTGTAAIAWTSVFNDANDSINMVVFGTGNTQAAVDGISPQRSVQFFTGGNPSSLWFKGGNSPIYFFTNDLVAMTIDASQRVGIGTTAPATSALLDLTSTTGALLTSRMTTTQKNALTAVNGMVLYDSTLDQLHGRIAGAWVDLGSVGGGGDVTKVGAPVNNQVGVWTGDGTIEGTDSFVFNGTSLGVGTNSPVAEFHAVDDGSAAGFLSYSFVGASPTAQGFLQFRVARGTEAAQTALVAGDTMGQISWRGGAPLGAWAQASGDFAAVAAENFGTGVNWGTDFVWKLTPKASAAIGEVMRLKGEGELWLTEIAASATPTAGFGAFYVKTDGNPYFKNDAGTETRLNITASGNVTKVGTPVDNQVGVWTGDGTIEGTTGLTWSGTSLAVTASNDGGASVLMKNTSAGTSASSRVHGSANETNASVIGFSSANSGSISGVATAGAAAFYGSTVGGTGLTRTFLGSWSAAPVHIITDNASSVPAMTLLSDGRVGIGTTAPPSGVFLSVVGGDGTLFQSNETNATNKITRLGTLHYTLAEEPFYAVIYNSQVATNSLFLGGGSSFGNAATKIGFYTAANATTTVGSERMNITSGGQVGIGLNVVPAASALLDLESTTGALLVTRMTTTQKNALTASNGMVLYDNTLGELHARISGAWVDLAGGGGNVTKVGTPVDNQIGVWTGDGTIEGDANFTWDGAALTVVSTGANGITSIRDTALASGVSATAAILHRTSVNMTGEIGPELRFQIEDDTSGVLNIAGVSAVRDGADNSGALRWVTWNGGVGTEKMRLTSVGFLGLGGATTVVHDLEITKTPSPGVPVSFAIQNNENTLATSAARLILNAQRGDAYVQLRNTSGGTNFWTITNDADIGPGTLTFGTAATPGTTVRMALTQDGRMIVGGSAPATSALLDLTSTTGTLLIPRMTTTQKNLLTGVAGMVVYDSTIGGFEFYDGTWGTFGVGDVTKVGTPVNNQIGVWTGDGTIEGDTGLTWDGVTLIASGAPAAAAAALIADHDSGATTTLVRNAAEFRRTTSAVGGVTDVTGGVGVLFSVDRNGGTIDEYAILRAFRDGGSASTKFAIGVYDNNPTPIDVAWFTKEGRVGIGTSTPSNVLHAREDVTPAIVLETIATTPTFPPELTFARARAASASVAATDFLGGVGFYGRDSVLAGYAEGAFIDAVVTTAPANTGFVESDLILYASDGAASQEVMRLEGATGATKVKNDNANGQTLNIRAVSTVITVSGGVSTFDTTGTFIPAGAFILSVSSRVTTVFSTATNYHIAFGGAGSDDWGTNISGALNTTSDNSDWNATGANLMFPSGGEVRLTAVGGVFNSGAVRVTIHYIDCSAPTS